MNGSAVDLLRTVTCLGVTIDQQLTFADHARRIIGRCFHCMRQLPSIRRTLTTGTAISLVNALVISRINYCNTELTGVYCVHMWQLQGIPNAAERLIVYKLKFDNISSMIRDDLHWLQIQQRIQCAHWCPTVFTASHPSTCRPCSNQSPRISADTVYVRLHVDIWLFLSQGRRIVVRASFTVVRLSTWNSLFAGVAARPVINPNILLPPTQDLSFRHSVCFIITLVTVISLLEWANITVPYKHTYNRYVQSTDRMTDGRTDDLPWQYRAMRNVAR